MDKHSFVSSTSYIFARASWLSIVWLFFRRVFANLVTWTLIMSMPGILHSLEQKEIYHLILSVHVGTYMNTTVHRSRLFGRLAAYDKS